VGNSKARRQVLEWQIGRVGKRDLQSWKERVAEEVRVKRAYCEGGRRQIVPKDSRNV